MICFCHLAGNEELPGFAIRIGENAVEKFGAWAWRSRDLEYMKATGLSMRPRVTLICLRNRGRSSVLMPKLPTAKSMRSSLDD